MIDDFIHDGIISVDDIDVLKRETANEGRRVIFMDATFVLPTSKEDITANFINARIPDAVFFDIKKVADEGSTLPHMIPDKDHFSNAISDLGIKNNDIVIAYGQHGMIMGPARAWWMFKGFGLGNIGVLNGGLPAWLKAGNKIATGKAPHPARTEYQATEFKHCMVTNMHDLIQISDSKNCPIIDARPTSRFSGSSPEPRDSMRCGHIPNSVNLPCSDLVDNTGNLKNKADIIALFKNIGVDVIGNKPDRIITTCGSGITACALTLALYNIGYKDVCVYDGSWSDVATLFRTENV